MLRIRLRRTGARKKPQYRLVVAESTSPRDGRYIEIVGTYNPLTNPSTINLKTERAQYWLSVGAQPSDRVHKILAGQGLMEEPTYVTAAKAAKGEADEAAAGDGATSTGAAAVATTSAAMAPAVEEAGASGPIPDVDDAEATASADAADDTPGGTVDETTADAAEVESDATTAKAGETPDAASEAV